MIALVLAREKPQRNGGIKINDLRYFFHIAFKGTAYAGWQRQRGVNTVQEQLENTFYKVLKENIKCIGCGRTDAGVHASQYFFHSDLESKLQVDLIEILNKNLPNDIVIYDLIPRNDWPHSQLDAISRTYDYFVHTSENPFLSEFSTFYPLKKIDQFAIKKALNLILNYTDFRAFCKTPDRHNHTHCEMHAAKFFINKNGTRLQFQLEANRFLKGMVRLLVGNLLEIGEGKMSLDAFEYHLKSGVAPQFMKLAYPQGLYLSKVTYSFMDIPTNRPDFFQAF